MTKKLETDLPHIIALYKEEGPIDPEYFNDPNREESTGWEDYAFHWLTAEEYAHFHLPGPNMAKRSEFLRFLYISLSIMCNIFTVPVGTEEYDQYMDSVRGIGK